MNDSSDNTKPPFASSPAFDDIESAAAKLGMDADALRARCRRAAQRRGDAVVAHLGGGIVAFKFGSSWRVRFPAFWSNDDISAPLGGKGKAAP